jgi:hypothetical protein
LQRAQHGRSITRMESLVPTAFWAFIVLHICFGSVGLVAF